MGDETPKGAAKKRLTDAEFRAAVAGREVGEQTIMIAHAVLVEGRKQIEFAQALGLTKGAISQAVARVWDAHQRTLPIGYERVCAVLPGSKAFVVKRWEEAAKRKLKAEKRE